MVKGAIQVGQQFRWQRLTDHLLSGTAVVRKVSSGKEEGMSSAVEAYAAVWIGAEGQSGSLEQKVFTVLLGTDGKSYLDGQEITVEII